MQKGNVKVPDEIAHKDVQSPRKVLNEVIWLTKNINMEQNLWISRKICIETLVVKVNDLYDGNRQNIGSKWISD